MAVSISKIILTGYRATGKSTVARLLAERTGFSLIDTDRELEARLGPIATVVAEKGWPFFRKEEEKLLLELAGKTNAVISTGGGAITHREAWRRLIADGLAVWLTAPVEVILQRLSADAATAGQRPALTGSSAFDEVKSVLAEREPLYREGSQLIIDTAGNDPAAVARLILDHIGHQHGR